MLPHYSLSIIHKVDYEKAIKISPEFSEHDSGWKPTTFIGKDFILTPLKVKAEDCWSPSFSGMGKQLSCTGAPLLRMKVKYHSRRRSTAISRLPATTET